MIRQRYRDEFEQLGVDDLRKRLAIGMYDEDMRRAAREWIDEQEHGEERKHRLTQRRIQMFTSAISALALIVAILALLKK